jgi:hypothetical protein
MASIVPKPLYKATLGGEEFNVVFDTNINPTKRGIKIRFEPTNQNIDVRKLSTQADQIAVALQKRFADFNLLIERDTEVKNPMTIGFIMPLSSVSEFIMKKVLKGGE